MRRLRRRVHEILEIPSQPDDTLGRWFDRFIVTLIALNAFVIVWETLGDNMTRYQEALRAFEVFSLAVFSVEFLLRVWAIVENPRFAHPVTGRLRFLGTPSAIIDLLAIVPAFLAIADLRLLRVLRLLRLLKLGRYSESLRILGNVFKTRREELLMSLFVVGLALLVSSTLIYYAERDAQPEAFGSIPAAMWWSVVALTTTGYGDMVPVTTVGRLLGGVAALLGILAIALPVGIFATGFTQEMEARKKSPACPHCGKELHPKT